MKRISKILALVLIVMTVLMSLAAINASAADVVRVYCENEAGWDEVYCYYWGGSNGPNWPGNKMTYDAELDLWYYDIPSDHSQCIFNNGKGVQTVDLFVPSDDQVVYNNHAKAWGVIGGDFGEPETIKLYVNNTAGWKSVYCFNADENWNAEATWPGSLMTYDADLDLWYYNVPAGHYWCIFNGGNDQPQTSNLIIPTDDAVVYDNTTGLWATLEGDVEVPTAPTYTIAGSDMDNNGSIFGTAWDTNNADNLMTYDEETGVYTIVYENVPAGSYKFKACQNNGWDVCYGGGPNADGDGNFVVEVTTNGSKLTITLTGETLDAVVEAPKADEPTNPDDSDDENDRPTTPDPEAPTTPSKPATPEEENFFARIWAAIVEFFMNIGEYFQRLFA